MLGTLDSCAATFEENPSRSKGLSGRPVVWSGGLVQARRANVQARRTDKEPCAKFRPRTSRQNPGTSRCLCTVYTCEFSTGFSRLGAREARALLQFFENENFTPYLPFDAMSP